MKMRGLVLGLIFSMGLALAQSDPAAQQDREAERLKLLRAVDQLDSMTSQVEALRAESDQQKAVIESLKTQLATAQSDSAQEKADLATLKAAIEKLDAARADERDVLLKKVSEIVAEAMKGKAAATPEEPKKAESSAETGPEKGFNYVVKKGDTLSDIAKAYQAQGIKITIEDLRKANNLGKSSTLSIGQKLFIPQK